MGERLALGSVSRKGGRSPVKGPISGSMPVPFLATNPRIPFTGMRATALFRDTGQVGSLAGAAYLLHNNAGVLSEAQCEQKSRVEHKGKSLVDSRPSVLVRTVKAWPSDPLVPNSNVQGIEARGDRKITTGITGLWQPSVHSDVAF